MTKSAPDQSAAMTAPGGNSTPARLFRRSATINNEFNGPSSFLTLRRDPDGSISYVQAATTKAVNPMRLSITSDGVEVSHPFLSALQDLGVFFVFCLLRLMNITMHKGVRCWS